MNRAGTYVIFMLNSLSYALPRDCVDIVLRAVEITPLPKAPDIVSGLINMRGRLLPVLNIRKRLGLPEREIELSDQIIVAHTSRRPIAFLVDAVSDIAERSEDMVVPSDNVVAGLEHVKGIIKLADGIVLVNDIDSFFSLEEEKKLDEAMEDRQ